MFRYVRQAPVTFASLVLMAMVFAGTHGIAGDSHSELARLMRVWGAVTDLTWVTVFDDRAEIQNPDLHGPFDLWDGDWWRVPLSSLHHVAFWHLLLNSLFVAVLGRVLEGLWGSWRYLLFLLGAAFVSLLPEFLVDHYAIGYSGIGCAMLGALMALRRTRPEAAACMSDWHVGYYLAVLVGMWLLTELGAFHVANLAHFTGLGYGWCVAQLSSRGWPLRVGLVGAHALLIVPYWYVTHPVGNGRYHWYRAGLTDTGHIADREDPARLRLAVQRDPALTGVWRLLAEDAERTRGPLEAWRLTLRGLHARPSDAALWSQARRLWRELAVGSERQAAVAEVGALFGEESTRLLNELRRLHPPPILIAPNRPIGRPTDIVSRSAEIREWQASPAEAWQMLSPRPEICPSVNPSDPQSALEGRLL